MSETCDCELRDRAWDPNTLRCRSCGRRFEDERGRLKSYSEQFSFDSGLAFRAWAARNTQTTGEYATAREAWEAAMRWLCANYQTCPKKEDTRG